MKIFPPFRIPNSRVEADWIKDAQYHVLLKRLSVKPLPETREEARLMLSELHPDLLTLIEDLISKSDTYYDAVWSGLSEEDQAVALSQAEDALIELEEAVSIYHATRFTD